MASHDSKDLGLGVFEGRRGACDASAGDSDTEMVNEDQARNASSSDSGGTAGSHSDSDSSDGYDSDSSVDIISSTLSTFGYRRPIRPLPRRASTRPDIVVLDKGSFAEATRSGWPFSAGGSPS